MRPSPAWLAAAAWLASQAANAAIFPVGTGLGCGYATVQAAVNHAATYPGDGDVIRVSRSLTYTNQAIVVGNQSVEIVGGFDDCLDSTSSGTTTLGGAGGATDSVIRIETDGRVALRHLTISGGDESDDGYGGGVEFRGNGVLEIVDSSISNNRAGYGGGIHAVGTGALAELILGANVLVSSNVAAQRGGGLYVEGVEMTMTAPGSLVAFNSALTGTGDGGGMLLRSGGRPSYAYIGSPGQGGLGTFYGNRAKFGGAVAVIGGDNAGDEAVLKLFATDADHPPALRENAADVAGGAIFLRPDVEIDSDLARALAEISNAVVDGNSAPNGAAFYLAHEGNWAGNQEGGRIEIGVGLIHPQAVHCTRPVACTRIINNQARIFAGAATEGSIVHLGADASLTGRRVEFSGNRGGRVLHGINDDYTNIRLEDSVLAGNTTTRELIRLEHENSYLTLEHATIGANVIGGTHVLSANGVVEMREVLIGQPGLPVLAPGANSRVVEDTISTEVATLGGLPGAVLAAPRFIDPERGNVRLRAASPAVDYLPAVAGDDRDVVGAPRDQVLPGKLGVGGPRDIGAYERPALQPLVLNGGFADDLRLWPGPNSSWDGAQDAAASASSGAALLQHPNPAQARVSGAAHCVHLPGPGRYLLNASGKAVSNRADNRDPVALHWGLRSDGGEACTTGLTLRQGDHVLTSLNAWNRPLQPAVIDINAVEWTRNSSITVTLVVTDSATLIHSGVVGWFDDITLELTALPTSGLPFANGFEN